MKIAMNAISTGFLAAGLMAMAGRAAAVGELNLGLVELDGSGSTWVNVRFIDLDFLGDPGVSSGFATFRNAVELQITTSPRRDPASGPAFSPAYLASAGLSSYPDLGVVSGGGNLGVGESLHALFLNFNPAKDAAKLRLMWAGARRLGFPSSGAAPVELFVQENYFVGGLEWGMFDIAIGFAPRALGPGSTFDSKLVFRYVSASGSDENLDPSDFEFNSFGTTIGRGFSAIAQVQLRDGFGTTFFAAPPVPEPSTYAILGAGLAALGFVAYRRKASCWSKA